MSTGLTQQLAAYGYVFAAEVDTLARETIMSKEQEIIAINRNEQDEAKSPWRLITFRLLVRVKMPSKTYCRSCALGGGGAMRPSRPRLSIRRKVTLASKSGFFRERLRSRHGQRPPEAEPTRSQKHLARIYGERHIPASS